MIAPPAVTSLTTAARPGHIAYENGRAAQARGQNAQALEFYKAAAANGNTDAENAIGGLYDSGTGGVPQDFAESRRWYRLGAEHGDQWAQLNLGYVNSLGRGAPQDEVEALRWYRLAAAQGNAFAEQNIGADYAAGRGGLPRDYTEALRWLHMAADQGNPAAQFNIAGLYYRGEGVAQNYPEAFRWYRLVTQQADRWSTYPVPAVVRMVARAEAMVGTMYSAGQGVDADPVQARTWITKASALGDPLAQKWLAAHPR